ncbi:MAG: PDZ domain-containing protein [Candidatus Brocadiales bacterium]|nr:PDZ domain-containing protein [Candidatus Brocadiales bacterium]
MIRRLIFLTLIQFSILFSQTHVAVVDFEGLGVSNDDTKALSNRLMIEMHRTNKFIVLEREMLDKIIEEQKFQLSGCNADQCLVELGAIANVQQIVGGSISKVGNVYSITARLISVESGKIIESALYDYEGNIGALMKTGMANVAAQLASIPASIEPSIGMERIPSKSSADSSPKNTEHGYPQTKPENKLDFKVFGLNFEQNENSVTVIGVEPNSPANKAGILVGDKIFKLNNEYAVTSSDLKKMITLFINSGKPFTIYYIRNGNSGVLPIRL